MREGVYCVSKLDETSSDKFCIGRVIAQFMEHLGDLRNLLSELEEAPVTCRALGEWDLVVMRIGSRFGWIHTLLRCM